MVEVRLAELFGVEERVPVLSACGCSEAHRNTSGDDDGGEAGTDTSCCVAWGCAASRWAGLRLCTTDVGGCGTSGSASTSRLVSRVAASGGTTLGLRCTSGRGSRGSAVSDLNLHRFGMLSSRAVAVDARYNRKCELFVRANARLV